MRATELDEQDAVVYRSRRRQLLIVAGMVALFVLLWAQTQQPDYETHVKPQFSKYVWELAPFLLLTVVMAIRAFRVRCAQCGPAMRRAMAAAVAGRSSAKLRRRPPVVRTRSTAERRSGRPRRCWTSATSR